MKYNSKSESSEMSYFRLNLLAFLQASHPDKASDLTFIAERGDLASEAYSQAVKNGFDQVQASEIANEVLFEGLHFSPYNLIVEILWNEFYKEIVASEANSKAKELLPQCQVVFEKYDIDDDFVETPEYQSLYTELVGTILILLENELQ